MTTIRILPLTAAAFAVLLSHAASAENTKQEQANKKTVIAFYDAAINKKDFDAAAKYLGDKYVQHNSQAADGPEGLKGYIQFLKGKYPAQHNEFKHVYADGDHVIVHVHSVQEPGSRGRAIIDIFRLENGKVVEHWDVIQEIPEKASNQNGMF